MSASSTRINRARRRFRQRNGVEVILRPGADQTTHRVITEEVAGAKAGTQTLPYTTLGPYIASADPRVFSFDSQEFRPFADLDSPVEGNSLLWHGLEYVLTHIEWEDLSDDTVAILAIGYRKVI